MKNVNTNRQDFIKSYRREHAWAGPAVAIGAILIGMMPLLIETSLLGYLGSAILAPVMVYAAIKSYHIFRGTDAEVLRAASELNLGIWAIIGLGMVLLGADAGGTSQAIISGAILLCVIQGEMKRVAQAQEFVAEAA